MEVAEELRRFFKDVNERQWADAESAPLVAPDLRLHIPAIGLEATSWAEAMAGIRAFVERIDAHYEVEDVVEHGPLVVAFVTNTGTVDGRRSTWPICVVYRMDDGKVVENWSLRGGDPVPVDAG